MGRRKLPYPPEFREEAVRLIREGGKSIGQVAKDLGISDQSLRSWVKQSDLDTGRRTDGLTTEERVELRRLRRENRVLREERESLKKAAAFFALCSRAHASLQYPDKIPVVISVNVNTPPVRWSEHCRARLPPAGWRRAAGSVATSGKRSTQREGALPCKCFLGESRAATR